VPCGALTLRPQNGAHVLIGTPGRLDDVMARSGSLSLRRLELLVLDEADRLLSMGFSAQVGSILRRLPKQRRTGLFSATQTEEVEELARAGLRNPVRITVRCAYIATAFHLLCAALRRLTRCVRRDTAKGGPACGGKTPSQLSLYHGMCSGSDDKLPRLVAFLQRHAQHKVIVYFLTCACVDFYADALGGLPQLAALMLTPLHGRMKQSHRERALEQYSTASCGVLLATDVAARGLDIPGVDWVLQFDPPQDPAAFLHRCGRTARMGAAGASIAFLLPSEDAYLGFLALRSLQLVPAPDCQHAPPHSHNDAAQEQALFAALRGRAETEREFMEKAARAFVSFVRGYKEHQCRFIFRLKELELGRLARAFGLLRMPRMPETKRVDVSSTFQASAVVPDDVPYRDRAREKLRLARNREAAYEAAAAAAAAPHHVRAAPRVQPQAEQPASRAPTAQKRRLEQTRCDEDDLDADWKLLRKLKAGKISEHQYNVQAGLSSDSEQEQEQEQQARADKRPAKKQQQQHGRGNGKAQSRGGRGGGRR